MNIFNYTYMQRALFTGLLLSITIPCIGMITVNKRISMIGDALSHTALAGVIFGLIIGLNPIVGSVIFCIVAALFIEFIRKRFPGYSDLATAIIMSTGVGLAGLFSGFVKKAANFESFLFGSIVAIDSFEMLLVSFCALFIMSLFIYYFKDLMYITFDETGAKLSGVKTTLVNTIFTIITALTIAIASRTIGVLIVSSILVIPVACALQLKKGYYKTLFYSIFFGILFTMSGLVLSFYLGLKPGGTIVLISTLTLIIIIFIKTIKNHK
ncbi:MAG: metal ABC transporter permease [Tissierellia bacterium]|nr:metal ABC transporter permease [Tissierellia bacterium]